MRGEAARGAVFAALFLSVGTGVIAAPANLLADQTDFFLQ